MVVTGCRGGCVGVGVGGLVSFGQLVYSRYY